MHFSTPFARERARYAFTEVVLRQTLRTKKKAPLLNIPKKAKWLETS